MAFIHPKLQPLIEAGKGQPSLADVSVEDARAVSEQRATSRPKGPDLDSVKDLNIPAMNRDIPVRIYSPENPIGVAIAFHGGGWIVGSIEAFDATCRYLARDSGVAVVSVGYRLAPEHPFPAAVDDAWAATQWVAKNGHSLGVPTDRLIVLGESAGGNLAAVVALMARDAGGPEILLQALVYPVIDARMIAKSLDEYAEGFLLSKRDIAYIYRQYGIGKRVDTEDWRLSPLLAASHTGVAPAFLISAECDPLRDDAKAYAQRLQEEGVVANHVCYSGATHLFFTMRGVLDIAEMAQKQVASVMRAAVKAEILDQR